MATPHTVSLDIAIMGREFRINCPASERAGLLEAVAYLDRKMREIRDSGKVAGAERIAMMAALNIAHDHLNKSHAGDDAAARACLARVSGLVDQAIAQQDNLF
jgi:cell division protein ZapA